MLSSQQHSSGVRHEHGNTTMGSICFCPRCIRRRSSLGDSYGVFASADWTIPLMRSFVDRPISGGLSDPIKFSSTSISWVWRSLCSSNISGCGVLCGTIVIDSGGVHRGVSCKYAATVVLIYSSVKGCLLYAMCVPSWSGSAIVSSTFVCCASSSGVFTLGCVPLPMCPRWEWGFLVLACDFGCGPLPVGVAGLVVGISTLLSLLWIWLLSRLFLRLSAFFFELR